MLIVLDTNIFISAILSASGPPARIYEAWREKRFEIATCTEQIEEIRTASRYPKLRAAVHPYQFGHVINQLKQSQVWTMPIPRLHTAEDPTDSFLLNLAVVAEAHFLITGDKRSLILERKKLSGTRIHTARSFCEQVLNL